MLPLANNQNAEWLINYGTSLAVAPMALFTAADALADGASLFKPDLTGFASRFFGHRFFNFLPVLREKAPKWALWANGVNSAFDLYQILDRLISGDNLDGDFNLFIGSLLSLGQAALYRSNPMLSGALGLAGILNNVYAVYSHPDSNENKKELLKQAIMMGALALSRQGRTSLKGLRKLEIKKTAELKQLSSGNSSEEIKGPIELGGYIWEKALGYLPQPWPKRVAWGLPILGVAYTAYEKLAPDCYSGLNYLNDKVIHEWVQADHLAFINILNDSNEPCLRSRAVNYLGELLGSGRLTSEERAQVIQKLMEVGKEEDSQELKPEIEEALSQASKRQQKFLLRANPQKDKEKIVNAIVELMTLGGDKNIRFLTDNPVLSSDIQEIASRYIERKHWPTYLRILLEEGTLSEAIEKQRVKVGQIPKNNNEVLSQAQMELGTLELTAHHFKEAEEAFNKAIELDNGQIEAYMGLADLALKKNEPTQALSWLDKVEPLASGNSHQWKIRYNRAIALMQNGEVAEAMKTLKGAVEEIGRDPIQEEEWANFYHATGDLNKALEYIKKAEKRYPEDPTIKNDWAVILGEKGKGKEAIAIYEKVFEIFDDDNFYQTENKPEHEKYGIFLANFLYRLGQAKQYDKAYNITEKLLADPYTEILEDYIRQSIFQLKNEEFTDAGADVQLVKLKIPLLDLSSSANLEKLEEEITYWKNKVESHESPDSEKQKALVVLARLSSFLSEEKKIDLALWTVKIIKNQSARVQEFGIIASGRMIEGTGKTSKLDVLANWLDHEMQNPQMTHIAEKILGKTFPHLDEKSLSHWAQKFSLQLQSPNTRDRIKALDNLSVLLPYLPPDQYSTYLDLIAPALDDKNYKVARLAFGIFKYFIPLLKREDQLRHTQLIASHLTDYQKNDNDNQPVLTLIQVIPSLEVGVIEIIAQQLFDKIESESGDKVYSITRVLTELIVYSPMEKRITWADKIAGLLENDSIDIQRAALRTLNSITPLLPPENREKYSKHISEKLNDANSGLRTEAMEGIISLAISSDKTNQEKYISLLETKLEDETPMVVVVALEKLSSIVPFIPNKAKRYSQLFSEYAKRDQYPEVRCAALRGLETTFPFLEKKDQLDLLDLILHQLDSENPIVRISAGIALGNLIPDLDEKNQSKYVLLLFSKIKKRKFYELTGNYNIRSINNGVVFISPSSLMDTLENMIPSLSSSVRLSLYQELNQWLKDEKDFDLAISFIKILFPYLDEPQQKEFALQLVEKLENPRPRNSSKRTLVSLGGFMSQDTLSSVISLIREKLAIQENDPSFLSTLFSLTSFMSPSDQLVLIDDISNNLENSNPSIRASAFSALETIFPKLSNDQQLDYFNRIRDDFLEKQDYSLLHVAEGILKKVIPNLDESTQQLFLLQIFTLSKNKADKHDEINKLGTLSRLLYLFDRNKIEILASTIKEWLQEKDPVVRANALKYLGIIIPLLDDADQENYLAEITNLLNDENSSVQESACLTLIKLYGFKLPDREKSEQPFILLNQLVQNEDSSDDGIKMGGHFLSRNFSSLSDEKKKNIALQWAENLGHEKSSVRNTAINLLPEFFESLNEEEKQLIVNKIEEKLDSPDPNIRASSVQVIGNLIPLLDPENRMEPVKRAIPIVNEPSFPRHTKTRFLSVGSWLNQKEREEINKLLK